MLRKFELDTSGVLLVVSKSALQTAFLTQPFNYDFPEGILPLVNSGGVLAVVTESGEDVKGRLLIDAPEATDGFSLVGTQKFCVKPKDEIFILSHSEFTQICDWHKGDIAAFSFHHKKQMLKKPNAGWYTAKIYAKLPKNGYIPHFILEMTSETAEPALAVLDAVARF